MGDSDYWQLLAQRVSIAINFVSFKPTHFKFRLLYKQTYYFNINNCDQWYCIFVLLLFYIALNILVKNHILQERSKLIV